MRNSLEFAYEYLLTSIILVSNIIIVDIIQ